jgi:hypothetical protein
VPEGMGGVVYRNALGARTFEAGTKEFHIKVEGMMRSQWICLGIATAADMPRDVYYSAQLCTFSSSNNTFAPVLSGAGLTLSNNDVVVIRANVSKRQMWVKKKSASSFSLKMRIPAGPCRLFACLFRAGNKVTVLSEEDIEDDGA